MSDPELPPAGAADFTPDRDAGVADPVPFAAGTAARDSRHLLVPWAGLGALVLWLRFGGGIGVLLPAFLLLIPLLRPRSPDRRRIAAGILGWAAVAIAAVTAASTRGGDRGSGPGSPPPAEVVALAEESVLRTLAATDTILDRIARRIGAGRSAAEALAEIAPGGPLAGLAILDASGNLERWTGNFRGVLPWEVRLGEAGFLVQPGSLRTHLHRVRDLDGGGVVVAILLLDSELAEEDPVGVPLAHRISRQIGMEVRLAAAGGGPAGSARMIEYAGEEMLSLRFLPRSAEERIGSLRVAGGRIVLLLVLAAVVLLASSAPVPSVRSPLLWGTIAVGAVVAPLELLFPGARLFSPGSFLTPGPVGLTLGVALLLAVAIAAGRRIGSLDPSIPPVRGGTAVVLLFIAAIPAVLAVLRESVSVDLAGGEIPGWILFQLGMSVLLFIVMDLLLRTGGARPIPGLPPGRFPVLLALAIAAALSVLATLAAMRPQGLGVLWSLAWVIPIRLASGVFVPAGILPARLRAPTALLLALSISLPWAWGERVSATRALVGQRMERLGTRADPLVEALLVRIGGEATRAFEEGARGFPLLTSVWRSSGLAEEELPVRLTHWSPTGVPLEELRVGVEGSRPPALPLLVREWSPDPEIGVRRYPRADLHYLTVAVLPDGTLLSAAIPPIRSLGIDEPVGWIFGLPIPAEAPAGTVSIEPLGEASPQGSGAIAWDRIPGGLRAELPIDLPEGPALARVELRFPPLVVLLARGLLLVLLNLAGIVLARIPGRLLRGELRLPWPSGWDPRTFSGRVSIALLLFILTPTAIFGTLALRGIGGVPVRQAELIAARAVDAAAAAWIESGGDPEGMAARAGAPVLVYQGGGLVAASAPDLAEIGLFPAWLPLPPGAAAPPGASGFVELRTGGWQEVLSWQSLPGRTAVAVPIRVIEVEGPLSIREIEDLILLSLLLGGILALALALAVGSALARPLLELQRASERVGAGDFAVSLPAGRPDEFGAVFAAFNRMIAGLRAARAQRIRSHRRTRAIVEGAATGVVALDAARRIRLMNRTAVSMLGEGLHRGGSLAEGGSVARSLEALLHTLESEGTPEGGMESSTADGRRIRARVRRIPIGGAPPAGTGSSRAASGWVASVEDVTEERNAERIVAWGEMAQQVAHEVKNPLTPMKLAVQHLRRAWRDSRHDFTLILDRNLDLLLREIDRLAATASSFARLSVPGTRPPDPLEPIRLREAVADVVDLYRAGEESLRIEAEVPDGLPPVSARRGEFREVLANLLENARAASVPGGTVRIRVGPADGRIRVTVEDHGTGIGPEVLPRIFEPHFSTRSSGAGLGLAIVRRLVDSWGGEVRAETVPGEGTRMILDLDVASGGVLAPPPEAEGADAPRGSGGREEGR